MPAGCCVKCRLLFLQFLRLQVALASLRPRKTMKSQTAVSACGKILQGFCGTQVGTLNYMSPEAILGGSNNIRGGPPMKVPHTLSLCCLTATFGADGIPCRLLLRMAGQPVHAQSCHSLAATGDVASSAVDALPASRVSVAGMPSARGRDLSSRDSNIQLQKPDTPAGGAPFGHLEPGLHPVPDGVRQDALLRSGLRPQDARHHQRRPRHRLPAARQRRAGARHPPLPGPRAPDAHHHEGAVLPPFITQFMTQNAPDADTPERPSNM